MTEHGLPFENKWTSGALAERWHQELARQGVPNVRMIFAVRSVEGDPDRHLIGEIPSSFIADWLAYYDRQEKAQLFRWRVLFIGLLLVAAVAAVIAAIRA